MDGNLNLESCIVRILIDCGERLDSKQHETAGTGFLVSSMQLLTCAHVVAIALGIPETCMESQVLGHKVTVEIHSNTRHKQLRVAEVVAWRPVVVAGANHSPEDSAVLQLAVPTSLILGQVPLIDHQPGRKASVYGFGTKDQRWVSCSIAGNGRDWTEFECVQGEVLPGYSGAPIFDERHTAIIGMVVGFKDGTQTAYMISAAILREVMRGVQGEFTTDVAPLTAHTKVTAERLKRAGAKPFMEALQRSLHREFTDETERQHFSQPDRICEWVANRAAPESLFDMILTVMQEVRESAAAAAAERSAAADAAIALFTLVACRLVDRAGARAGAGRGYVLKLQRSASVVYAVVATSLFGGVIELRNEDNAPTAPNVLKIVLPVGAEQPVASLERHVYAKLLYKVNRTQAAQQVSAAEGRLTPAERADMLRLLALYGREKVKLIVVMDNPHYEFAAVDLASDMKLPMLIEHTDAVSMLLHMTHEELAGRFNEMWTAAQWLRSGERS